MIDVSTSSAMIRLDFIDRTATYKPYTDLLEGGLCSQSFHGLDVVKSHATTEHYREQWLRSQKSMYAGVVRNTFREPRQ